MLQQSIFLVLLFHHGNVSTSASKAPTFVFLPTVDSNPGDVDSNSRLRELESRWPTNHRKEKKSESKACYLRRKGQPCATMCNHMLHKGREQAQTAKYQACYQYLTPIVHPLSTIYSKSCLISRVGYLGSPARLRNCRHTHAQRCPLRHHR